MMATTAPRDDIRLAKMDRAAVFKAPSTGWQLGLAMVEAAAKSQKHPLATQIGRVAVQIAGRQ